jgi:hypothetical protein
MLLQSSAAQQLGSWQNTVEAERDEPGRGAAGGDADEEEGTSARRDIVAAAGRRVVKAAQSIEVKI